MIFVPHAPWQDFGAVPTLEPNLGQYNDVNGHSVVACSCIELRRCANTIAALNCADTRIKLNHAANPHAIPSQAFGTSPTFKPLFDQYSDVTDVSVCYYLKLLSTSPFCAKLCCTAYRSGQLRNSKPACCLLGGLLPLSLPPPGARFHAFPFPQPP